MFENARPPFSPSPRGTGSTAGVQHLSQTSTDKSADLLPCTISGCFDSETLIHTGNFESQVFETAGTPISHFPHGAELVAAGQCVAGAHHAHAVHAHAVHANMTYHNVFVCISVCVYAHVHVHVHVYMYVYMYTYLPLSMYM